MNLEQIIKTIRTLITNFGFSYGSTATLPPYITEISTEQDVLKRYSTPGLRRSQLSYEAKKLQLQELRLPANDIDRILNELYSGERT